MTTIELDAAQDPGPTPVAGPTRDGDRALAATTAQTAQTGRVRSRLAVGAVLLAASVPGLLLAPVFGVAALVPPIAVVLVVCFAVAELCRRLPALIPFRAPLVLLAGLLGIVETELRDTTFAGLPTSATVHALVAGCTQSWQLTLQSTWPALPRPELLLFVPLAVLLVALLGIELVRRPLLALLPSLLFLGVSQAFVAVTGPAALLAALGYAAVLGVLLGANRIGGAASEAPRARPARGILSGTALVVPTALLGVLAAVIGLVVLPVRAPAVSLQQNDATQVPTAQLANPLDEVPGWLRQPGIPVFSYTATESVDRWRLAVLDDFDGVSWTPDARYQRMGLTIGPNTGITAPTDRQNARLTVVGDTGGPWLPSQAMPASVTGVDSLIDEQSGTLVDQQPRSGSVNYQLAWWEPRANADMLAAAAIDPTKEAGAQLGAVPAGISQLAATAVHGIRPSFSAALVLARYLSQHYQLATGSDLPTGSGWPQLRNFLLTTKRGTSVQFAAAYVVLARLLGIPARIAVGFRAPDAGKDGRVVIHDSDALAWPEVAVAGLGWVPLDPTGVTSSAGGPGSGLSGAVDKALTELPRQQDLRSPPLRADQPATGSAAGSAGAGHILLPLSAVLLGLLLLAALGFLGVPLLRAMRYRRRRRLPGIFGVVAACQEAVDRLRANGIPVDGGMTVRELAAGAAPHVPPTVAAGLLRLADLADLALWSGLELGPLDQAWVAVAQIRRGLRSRPLRSRLRATFNPVGLFGGPIGAGSRPARPPRPVASSDPVAG